VGLPQYIELFEREQIDLRVLPELCEADLIQLALPLGPRKLLLKAIANLAGTHSPGDVRIAASASHSERRQLTVLFCDMVGFTDLASRLDPEVLQNIVRRYEDTCAASVARYEGYVFQRLGDGIVAFFGYPLAHEAEAERAIRAGLEIVESLIALDIPE